MRILSIPATAGQPWPDPPCSGNWQRLPDGGLQPADEATARAADLWAEPAAPAEVQTPAPATDQPAAEA